MVQVREPSWDEDGVRDLILRVRQAISESGQEAVRVLVNRRPALAAELRLDGVHVGGGRPSDVVLARSRVPSGSLVGYSAHSIPEIIEASRFGADYVTYSPIFGAISKDHPLPAVGVDGLREACRISPVPVLALGGVTPDRAAEVRRAGAAGAAMIGAILDAADPGEATARFLEAWEQAGPPGSTGGAPGRDGPLALQD